MNLAGFLFVIAACIVEYVYNKYYQRYTMQEVYNNSAYVDGDVV